MNINEKIDHLIDLTARVESGGDYSKWNPDDNGHGPSFGLIQFNATVGSLGKLLRLMAARAPGWFRIVFGCMPGDFEAFAREIADDPEFYEARLKLSGQVPIWQACQRQLSQEEYFDPAAKLCAKFGLVSERAHAMAFDVAVQYGVGGLERMFNSATTYTPTPSNEHAVLGLLASYGDRHEYDQQRRHKLLDSRELSDAPLFDAPPPTETRPTLRRGDSSMEVNQLLKLLLKSHGQAGSRGGEHQASHAPDRDSATEATSPRRPHPGGQGEGEAGVGAT